MRSISELESLLGQATIHLRQWHMLPRRWHMRRRSHLIQAMFGLMAITIPTAFGLLDFGAPGMAMETFMDTGS
jgi:hypothetical protein